MHRTLDVERIPQPVDVLHQVVRGVAGERHGRACIGDGRLTQAAAALVEQDDAVAGRIEEAGHDGRAGRARPAMQHHHRLARRVAIFFPIELVSRLLLDRQQVATAGLRLRIAPLIGDLAGGLQLREIHGCSSGLGVVMARPTE